MPRLSLIRQKDIYCVITALREKYPIVKLCEVAGIARSSYYKWLNRKASISELENQELEKKIIEIAEQVNHIYGYRRMTLAVNRALHTNYNWKRIRRIMRMNQLFSVIRRKKPKWFKSTAEHTAKNMLCRQFHAAQPNEKWCTDVTELKYGNGCKKYLSAIIDLYDRSIVSYILSNKNDNKLVMDTIKRAMKRNPKARPMIHSDRGFQYTSHAYRQLKEKFQFKLSMSRVAKCLDNQPIESFWGTLKAEYYYLHSIESENELIRGIHTYIDFYQNERVVAKFNGLTPSEYR
ncbi:IS3 family transposase, partial [Listeria booriae]|nr:IS3 family transposase [Listeria booriae]